MNFREHSNLKGLHAFFGASNYHWTNYDEEKMKTVYLNHLAVERGTRMHALAAELINLKVNLPKNKKTLNLYVNDCIGHDMTPEQVLYYSENFFGTCDAISFKKNKLKIFDYKSGETKASMRQLEVYAALFCLEYNVKPTDISIELRIYQKGECLIKESTPDEILHIMDKIVTFDKYLISIKEEI